MPSRPSESGGSRRFPAWRLVMIGGALLLLIAALSRAVWTDGFPRPLELSLYAFGYAGLAVGFGMAMRGKRRAAEEEGSTSRDRER